MNQTPQPEYDKSKGYPDYNRGRKWPAWFALAVPFLGLLVLLFRHVRLLCWGAVFFVVVLFEAGTLYLEHHAVVMGHWVYNSAKLLGPRIVDVPIEEPFIYYLFPPVFVIVIMQLLFTRFSRSPKKIPVVTVDSNVKDTS